MLKKAHYTPFKKEIIMELQKTVEGIFILGLQQFKAKSEKTMSDSHAISRINSNTKTGMQDLKT